MKVVPRNALSPFVGERVLKFYGGSVRHERDS